VSLFKNMQGTNSKKFIIDLSESLPKSSQIRLITPPVTPENEDFKVQNSSFHENSLLEQVNKLSKELECEKEVKKTLLEKNNKLQKTISELKSDQPHKELEYTKHLYEVLFEKYKSQLEKFDELGEAFSNLEAKLNLANLGPEKEALIEQNVELSSELEIANEQVSTLTKALEKSEAKRKLSEKSSDYETLLEKCVEYEKKLKTFEAKIKLEKKFDGADDTTVGVLAEANETIKDLQSKLKKSNAEISKLKLKYGAPKPNSKNSSMNSTSDFTKGSDKKKSDKKDSGKKKKKGAQPGHTRKVHELEPPENVDERVYYTPESTACECGHQMVAAPGADVIQQQYELPDKPIKVVEHRGQAFVCPCCGNEHKGEIPAEVKKHGLFGLNLTAFIISLKLDGRASYRAIKQILAEVYKINVSIGYLTEEVLRASKSLEPAFEEIYDDMKNHDVLNVDETTHVNNGNKLYAWVFKSICTVLFVIGCRDADIIKAVLGLDYGGVIGCDYYIVYRTYGAISNALLQHCLAYVKLYISKIMTSWTKCKAMVVIDRILDI
jgi:transposase